ncbi:MAG TPA: TlpA disulfide reductase family protein [Kofleriaceae bacterium]|nr:TlpA disulfide reductase family protein [Kofleriaceae bacterium]
MPITTESDPSTASVGASVADRARPASSRGTRALLGILLAGTVGMMLFLFVHLSHDGRIHTGIAPAQAECSTGRDECLPELDYVDTTGVAYTRASLAGKIVLVNFWATWCHPCEGEIPDLSQVYAKYKSQGVVFLGVVIDHPDSHKLLNFQSDHDMSYPVVRASDALMTAFHSPDAYPTTLVYDRHGKQVYSHLGALRERELDSLIGTLVAQN